MRGLVAGTIVVALLVAAPAATAAQRFAAPAGSGSECTKAMPCALPEAVGGAHAGDEVIVTGGSYTVGATIGLPSVTNVQVHGDTGGPPPKLIATMPHPVMEMYEAGDSISYLEIENDADGGWGIYCLDGKLERIRVRIVGNTGFGVLAYPNCNSVRNSLLLTEGPASTALRAVTNGTEFKLPVRNVTAISTGTGSSGVVAEYAGASPGSLTLELENSIVQGGQQDLRPIGNANGAGIIAASHSNFDTANPITGGKVVDDGGNQTAAAQFVNSEGGDYHEAAGSPTIDAGIADQLGALDLDGNPRVLGAAPDIGAYEFVPPVATAQIQSLAVKPGAFRAGNVAGAVASRKKKAAGPVGATVSYSLSAAGSVEFSVERQTIGRKAGKKCVKQTAANKRHRKCSIFKPVKGGFSVTGVAGANSFKFSGKLGGKALKPGRYRLIGSAGGAVESAAFKIVG